MTRRGRPRGETGSVLGRVLQLLEAFTAEHPEMRLTDLARRSGLPVSTVHRMVAELHSWGALERNEDGVYRIGLRLWELAALAPRGQGLRERALPYLEDLCQITRENVQLAVREGLEVVFLERLAGSAAVPTLTRVGGRLGLTVTGVGLVLLAHAPVEIQEEVLASQITRCTPKTVTDPRLLRRMLADIRTNGFAVSDRQLSMETLSVAAPVREHPKGPVVAAISLVVRYERASEHAYVPLGRASAQAIARVLAAPDADTPESGARDDFLLMEDAL